MRFLRDNGAELELSDLSEVEQQALLFAVVFDRIGLYRSIVLIDQPELFIHPDQEVAFLRALGGLGVDNQIIAATTSASILSEAPPQQVIRLGPRVK